MNVCLACGQKLRDAARFCAGCGEPVRPISSARQSELPPANPAVAIPGHLPTAADAPGSWSSEWQPPAAPRRSVSRNRAIGWVASAVVAGAVVGLTVLLVLRPGSAQTGPPRTAPAPQPPAQIAPDAMNPTIPTTRVPTVADVQQQVAADRSMAEGLAGSWVPQLSSKRLGLPVHGVTFGYPEILADFQALHARFPHSVLIRSDDYSSYGQPGYWVTVLAERYASPDAANAWCDANGIPAEDCYAHRLSHTGGPAGSSKTR